MSFRTCPNTRCEDRVLSGRPCDWAEERSRGEGYGLGLERYQVGAAPNQCFSLDPSLFIPINRKQEEGRQRVDFCEAGRKAKGGRKRRRRETHCSRLELPELIPLEWCARSLPSGGFLSPTPSRSSSGSPCYAHHQPEEQRRGQVKRVSLPSEASLGRSSRKRKSKRECT